MKRIGSLALLIFIFLLQSAFAGIPGMLQGQDYFDKQEYKQALAYLLTAFQHSPSDPNLNFLLGRTYFALGNYEAAVMAYERVLFSEPDSSRVKLEMARTYLALGSKEYAKKYFQEVLSTNPPEAVWNNIQRFLTSIKESERKHFFTSTVSFGIESDDNPRVAPLDDRIDIGTYDYMSLTGDGSEPESDMATTMTATANHIYRPPDSNFFWKTSGLTYNAFYNDQNDLDINYLEVSTGPAFKWGKVLWQSNIFATNVDIDQNQYQDSIGVSSTLTTSLHPAVILSAQVRYEDKDNNDYDFRSGDNTQLSVSPIFIINPARISLNFGVENESTESSIVGYNRTFWQVRVDSPIKWGFNVYGLFLVKNTDYKAADTLFNISRKDDYHEIGFGISKSFWTSSSGFQTIIGAASYKYVDTDSNIDLYSYRRNVVSLTCTYAF